MRPEVGLPEAPLEREDDYKGEFVLAERRLTLFFGHLQEVRRPQLELVHEALEFVAVGRAPRGIRVSTLGAPLEAAAADVSVTGRPESANARKSNQR